MNHHRPNMDRQKEYGIAFGEAVLMSSPPSRSQMDDRLESGFGGWADEKIQTAREAPPLLGRKKSYPQHLTISRYPMSNNGTSIRCAAAILATLAFVNIAGAFSGAGSGTESDPYIITNVNQLQEMNNDLDAWYELGNDIDASDTINWNGGEGFVPIGNDEFNRFIGNFNGKNYTIIDLFISRSSIYYQGLFGFAQNSEIKNVGLINIHVSGYCSVGGLVGINYGTISNSYATGSVGGNIVVGGLVGYNLGTISNSYATGNVAGANYLVGGLVGFNRGTISNSYASGGVTGGTNIGGLVGLHSGTILNSYATGNVHGSSIVGGLVGQNDGTISKSYSIGSVTGSSNIGGLIGNNYNTITNSYWDIETSGINTSSGGEGKTTAEMQTKSTFTNAGWDFVNIWTIREGVDYPRFIWQALPELPVSIDIKPGECPNPLNVKGKGVLAVAILGTEDFDVFTIDTASIRLAGVAPVRSSYEDVSTPVPDGADACECTTADPDGHLDLTLKFNVQDIVAALGQVNDGDVLELTLTGTLADAFGGTPIEGTDCVVIIAKGAQNSE